jgi:DNA-binding XRE family transcriptional regulator
MKNASLLLPAMVCNIACGMLRFLQVVFGIAHERDAMTFGQRLQRLREVAGLSQNELAKRAKVHRPLISILESGKQKSITLVQAQRLARALGVSLDVLAGPIPDDEPAPAELVAVG